MRHSILPLLALAAVSLPACKKDKDEVAPPPASTDATVSIRFQFVHGVNPFDINATYSDGFGNAVRLSTLKFYASDFHLEDDGGATVADFHDKVVLADGALPNQAYELGSMAAGHIHQVHFALGLDSATNHAVPQTAPYPLNIPGMHWSWNPAAGYKFLNLEGHVDGTGDGDFDDPEDKVVTYHCATDALLRQDHFHFHADVNGGAVTLVAKVDVAVLLMGLDLLTNSVAMGAGPANVQAMNNLSAAITEL